MLEEKRDAAIRVLMVGISDFGCDVLDQVYGPKGVLHFSGPLHTLPHSYDSVILRHRTLKFRAVVVSRIGCLQLKRATK